MKLRTITNRIIAPEIKLGVHELCNSDEVRWFEAITRYYLICSKCGFPYASQSKLRSTVMNEEAKQAFIDKMYGTLYIIKDAKQEVESNEDMKKAVGRLMLYILANFYKNIYKKLSSHQDHK